MKNISKYALIFALLVLNLEAKTPINFTSNQETNKTIATKPFYQGEVVNVEQGGSYTYIEVKERTHKPFWIATNSADVKIGDFIRFQKEIVVKNFKSKALNKVFKELMFASNLQYRLNKKTGT